MKQLALVATGRQVFKSIFTRQRCQILEKIEAQKGIMSIKDGDFEKVFEEIVGTWMDLYQPVQLSYLE